MIVGLLCAVDAILMSLKCYLLTESKENVIITGKK